MPVSVFLVFFPLYSGFLCLFSKELERKHMELGVWEGREDLEVLGEGKA